MPFQPWKDACVCVHGGECPQPRGEQRAGCVLPVEQPCTCAAPVCAFPSRWIYVRHACALLIRVFFFPCSWVFPPPTPTMHL